MDGRWVVGGRADGGRTKRRRGRELDRRGGGRQRDSRCAGGSPAKLTGGIESSSRDDGRSLLFKTI